ncbi:hypothetical protein D0W87_22815 [Escherichia coli]|nr:hypothetical protein [Escherichia coli]EEW3194612.1 hypothetical protein [Escherichia coli]EFN7697568.1 hypothetical protein [Escherichia coli]EFN7726173.1 hypothetical protein [Escherichia coli]EFN7774098.1 hypothetical protein [Escherichia coli]
MVNVAVIIPCAVNLGGRREIIGIGIGGSEANAFRLVFMLSFIERWIWGCAPPIHTVA